MSIDLNNTKEGLAKFLKGGSPIDMKNAPIVSRHLSKNSRPVRTAKSVSGWETYIFAADINTYTVDMIINLGLEQHTIIVKEEGGFYKLWSVYILSDIEEIPYNLGRCISCTASDMKFRNIFQDIIDVIQDDYKMNEPYIQVEFLDIDELKSIKDVVSAKVVSIVEKLGHSKEQATGRISSAIRQRFGVNSRNQLFKKDFHNIINFIVKVDIEKMKFRSYSK